MGINNWVVECGQRRPNYQRSWAGDGLLVGKSHYPQPRHPIWALILDLIVLFLIQLPANVPGEVAKDAPNAWSTAPRWENQRTLLALRPQPLQPFWGWTSRWKVSASPCQKIFFFFLKGYPGLNSWGTSVLGMREGKQTTKPEKQAGGKYESRKKRVFKRESSRIYLFKRRLWITKIFCLYSSPDFHHFSSFQFSQSWEVIWNSG